MIYQLVERHVGSLVIMLIWAAPGVTVTLEQVYLVGKTTLDLTGPNGIPVITKKCKTKTARNHKERELGCRYSCLLQLPYFDPVRMLIIDPMHNLYLGTTKYIFNLWIERNIITSESVDIINKRIISLVVPPEVQFGRLPACLNHPSSLTAEQWMLWVNYYSLYCLYDLIATTHFECWRHFVLASRLLCGRKLSNDEIKLADALLMQFCRKFETLYGNEAVRPNIHLHAHLADCVRDYGPMSTL